MRTEDTVLSVQSQQSGLFATKIPVAENLRMNLGDRIKQARERAGLSQAALAKAIGMKQQSLSALEAGRTSSTSRILTLADALGVSAAWLERGEDPVRYGQDEAQEKGRWTDPGRTPSGDLVTRSMDQWIRSQGVDPNPMHVWVQRGAAMEPTLRDGDYVAVTLGDDDIVDGAIYAIESGGKVRFRRLRETGALDLIVMSDNTDKTRFPDEIVPLSRRADVYVIGRARFRAGSVE